VKGFLGLDGEGGRRHEQAAAQEQPKKQGKTECMHEFITFPLNHGMVGNVCAMPFYHPGPGKKAKHISIFNAAKLG
jgi:hypothetical protein